MNLLDWKENYRPDAAFFILLGLTVLGWILFWVSRDDRFRRSLFLRIMPMTVSVGILTLFKVMAYLDGTMDLFHR